MVTIYVALEHDLFVAGDGNDGWRGESRLSGPATQCVAADPLLPGIVYCGTFGEGIWRSLDLGRTWDRAGGGLSQAAVTAVAIAAVRKGADTPVIWAGTEPSTLYYSNDRGQTWQEQPGLSELPSRTTWSFPPRPWTHHVRWISPDPVQPGRIYVSIEAGGVMRSLDGGNTWEDRKPGGPRDAHTLQTHRLAPGRVYAAAGDGYFESLDGGDTWRSLEDGLRHHYLWSVAVDPASPDTVLVSAAHGPGQAHNVDQAMSTVYRRTARGIWQEAGSGLPPARGTLRPVLATSESEPGMFYLASNHGLFRSGDAGVTWDRLNVPWPEQFQRQAVNGLAIVG